MALLSSTMNSRSSSSYDRKTSSESTRRSNTQASAYAVNADTLAMSAMHFSTCGAGASGVPSPPPSPDAAPQGRPRRPGLVPSKARSRSGDAAHHITEECERLFCDTLQAVFLVEKDTGLQTSLVMDAHTVGNGGSSSNVSNSGRPVRPRDIKPQPTITKHNLPTPAASPDTKPCRMHERTAVREYVEVWDYAGGARFRGFVADKEDERAMFIFFDREVIGKDLKPGLMALMELATSDYFDCSQLVVAVDRDVEDEAAKDVTRDLGWVGFELMMLDQWAGFRDCMSDRWMFLGMEV